MAWATDGGREQVRWGKPELVGMYVCGARGSRSSSQVTVSCFKMLSGNSRAVLAR